MGVRNLSVAFAIICSILLAAAQAEEAANPEGLANLIAIRVMAHPDMKGTVGTGTTQGFRKSSTRWDVEVWTKPGQPPMALFLTEKGDTGGFTRMGLTGARGGRLPDTVARVLHVPGPITTAMPTMDILTDLRTLRMELNFASMIRDAHKDLGKTNPYDDRSLYVLEDDAFSAFHFSEAAEKSAFTKVEIETWWADLLEIIADDLTSPEAK